MKNKALILVEMTLLVGLVAVLVDALTVNPASNVTADSANTAGTIVLRDTSGNFSAGTITATLTGNVNGVQTPTSKTLAQLILITPAAKGETYMCTDCSPAKIVIATGTAISNFSDAIGTTFK